MTQAHAFQPQAPLQNPMQAAVARVSKQQQVVDAVLAVCAGSYLPAYELILNPDIKKLVPDANKLSIILSEAFKRGKLGRISFPSGTTKYAYGPKTGGAPVERSVIKKHRLALPRKYTVTHTTANPKLVLEQLQNNPALQFHINPADNTYTMAMQLNNAEEAIEYLVASNSLQPTVRIT